LQIDLAIFWDLIFWTMVLAIFAIAAFILELVYRVIGPYRENKKKNRQEEKQKLSKLIQKHRASSSQLRYSIKQLRTDKAVEAPSGIDFPNISPDIDEKIREYKKNYARCLDWYEACKESITLTIERAVRVRLSETQKKYDIISFLDASMKYLIEGGKISKSWIETDYPSEYKNIEENLQEGWVSFNEFCIYLNERIDINKIRERYQMEIKELTELAEKIIKDLHAKIKTLES